METDTDTDAEGRAVIVAFCAEDDADWPCDIAHLLAELARVTSERDATLRRQYDELQADNGRLLGRIKSLENDMEHALASRLAAAEAALAPYSAHRLSLLTTETANIIRMSVAPDTLDGRELLARFDSMREYVCQTVPPMLEALRKADAALAGSREQATTTEGE
jgi:hypothetical protein